MVIQFTRGDTQIINFNLKDANGNNIELATGDKLYFTVKKDANSTDVIMQKVYPTDITYSEGKYQFTIEPTDTNSLEYGTYEYDIELKTGTYVKTLSKGRIELTDEITFVGDEA